MPESETKNRPILYMSIVLFFLTATAYLVGFAATMCYLDALSHQ